MTEEDAVDHWEAAGRKLLSERLERMGMDVLQDAFMRAARRVDAGEELTKDDIDNLHEALTRASHVVNMAAIASPEAKPSPDFWQLLDEEDRERYMSKYIDEMDASPPEE